MPKQVFNSKLSHGKIEVAYDKDSADPVEMLIYEDIGKDPWSGESGVTAKAIRAALKDVPRNRGIDVRFNSNGGDVREGKAIKTAFDEFTGKKTASIDGMAASVASWLPMDFDEIRAPAHAEMFIHDAWGICMGNSAEMHTQAMELDKNSDQIAQMYAKRTGKSAEEMRDLMRNGTLFTAEEAKEMRLIDKISDGEAVANFSKAQISNMKSKLFMLNKLTAAPQGGQQEKTKPQMKRKDKIALLNKWGVSVSKNAIDAYIDKMLAGIKSTLPQNAVMYKNGKDGEHSDDCDCQDCGMMKNAPEPDAEEPDSDAKGKEPTAPGKEGEMFKAATENKLKALENSYRKLIENQRMTGYQNRLDRMVENGKINALELPDWMNLAMATEEKDGKNSVLDLLDKREPILPGRNALTIELGEPGEEKTVPGLEKIIKNLQAPQAYYNRNGTAPQRLQDRMVIGENSKRIANLIGKMKTYDAKTGEMTGPLRDAWDRFEVSPQRNANTMTSGLLRQVILSEVMRAFRRAFTPLTYFAHNFGNVPLEGTDVVQVPYYPLATVASTEFLYANGYQITPTAQTLSKNITVGGIGNGVATAGSGRKYQALQFQAYEIRRQPWLDIQKLSVMAGEQLALDVRADIIGTQICQTNFGNAIWTGQPGSFDHTILGNVLMLAANNAFWPKRGRNVVVGTAYHANISIDPGLYPFLYSGNTDILDNAEIKNKYRFENVAEDPILPISSYVQGGSGNTVNGLDPYLAGYMCWPSAVIIATAPILPSPGVLKKLVAFEQITDDQTNLTFTYRFWGAETNDWDNEIIECTYGSGLGELKALFRLTSQGN